MKHFTLLFLAVCSVFQLHSQEKKSLSPIIFIYDASGSMWGQMQGKTKMEIASGVLTKSVNNLPQEQQVGLVAYGHRQKDDCQDVEFLVDVKGGTKSSVNKSLTGIKPLGKTPLAYSATQVIDKLRSTKMKATIILITDGIESCGGNICDVVQAAKKEGIDFRLHIVGFGLQAGETEQLKCAAKAGDGQYYDAADAGGLGDVLTEATTTTVDKPKNNFTVYAVKNGQPVDAYIKAYKAGTKTGVAAARTYRDTGHLYLPEGKYDLEINPLEGSDVKGITLANVQSMEGKANHQTVSFDAAKLLVTTLNNGEGWDAVVKIYDGSKVVASGRTYGRETAFDVNPGVYDVDMLALRLEGLDVQHRVKNVEIKAGGSQQVNHNFKSGIAMIGATTGSELIDAVVKIKEVKSKKQVGGGRTYTAESSNPKEFLLTPGTYEVSLNTLGKHKGKSKTFTLVVKEGETVEKITVF